MTPRRAKLLGALAAAVLALGWVAASRLRGAPCSGAIFFEFRPPLTEHGRYRIDVDLDRGERHCAVALELPLRGAPDKSRCPMALELKTRGRREASSLVGFAIGASAEHLQLSVRREEELLYDAKLDPRYSPYTTEREPGQAFCGERAFVEPPCLRGSSQCWPFTASCDGPEDCKNRQVCCIDPEWGASYGPSAASECTSSNRCLARVAGVACHQDRDCPNRMKCQPAPFADQFRAPLSVCR